MANGLLNIIQASNGLLDTKQASDFLGINDKSLANSRYTGTGIQIPYIKIGKIVRYRQSDLEAYIENNTFTHTGEARGLLDQDVIMGRKKLTRKVNGGFASIDRYVIECDAFKSLRSSSVKLLLLMTCDYKGNNNGDTK